MCSFLNVVPVNGIRGTGKATNEERRAVNSSSI
jgi:hypothetical protein